MAVFDKSDVFGHFDVFDKKCLFTVFRPFSVNCKNLQCKSDEKRLTCNIFISARGLFNKKCFFHKSAVLAIFGFFVVFAKNGLFWAFLTHGCKRRDSHICDSVM